MAHEPDTGEFRFLSNESCTGKECEEWQYKTDCMWDIGDGWSFGQTVYAMPNVVCPEDGSQYPYQLYTGAKINEADEFVRWTGAFVQSRNLTSFQGRTLSFDVDPGRGVTDSGGLVSGLFTYRGPSDDGRPAKEVDFEWVWGTSGSKVDWLQFNVWNPRQNPFSPDGESDAWPPSYKIWDRQVYSLELDREEVRYYWSSAADTTLLTTYHGSGSIAGEQVEELPFVKVMDGPLSSLTEVAARLIINFWGGGWGTGGGRKFEAGAEPFVIHDLQVDGETLQSPCAPVCKEYRR